MIKKNNRELKLNEKKKNKKKENKVKIYKSTFHIIHNIIFIAIICFVNSISFRFIILLLLKRCLHIIFCCAMCTVSNLHWIVISISITC